MELEEERRQDRVGQRVETVAGTNHHIVQELCNMTLWPLKLTGTFTEKTIITSCSNAALKTIILDVQIVLCELAVPRTLHPPMRAMGTPACSTCTVLSTAA